ncbi:kinase-like protein [Nemania sp. FL0031]|nr:kinase-like protein [Nemania sp. FL0031]
MAPDPDPKTLFHLVPVNEVAEKALRHDNNVRFVSTSRTGREGLEVGYHVSGMLQGRVITRLGRNTDLILGHSTRAQPMSRVHVAFEINPATQLVVLSVRSKQLAALVSFRKLPDKKKEKTDAPKQQSLVPEEKGNEDDEGKLITGDGVILYGQDYGLSIASYHFELIWLSQTVDTCRTLVLQDYQKSMDLLKCVRSRDQPTETDNFEACSWHITRINTAKNNPFKYISGLREGIGEGAFGRVYKVVDEITGNYFAVKVVELDKIKSDVDAARAMIHREIKVMEKMKHDHIIEYLGCQHFDTLHPEILMPLREGSITALIKERKISNHADFCMGVLEQMLRALDYLASKDMIHRDVKPDNILYYTKAAPGDFHFQLSDFGLANYGSLARTVCGTNCYQAPELCPQKSGIYAPQSTKMDVWSLYATIVAIHLKFEDFPPRTNDYSQALSILEGKASDSVISHMAMRHPDYRASAAQMLVKNFQGQGLTTPISNIPSLEPEAEEAAQAGPSAVAGPSNPPQTGNGSGKILEAAASALVVYPPPPAQPMRPLAQLPPIRAHKNGVVKNRSKPASIRTGALARLPPGQEAILERAARIHE